MAFGWKLGGYFFDLENARNLMKILGIKHEGLPEDRYERAINNWLFHNNKFHLLAAWIEWPVSSTSGTISKEPRMFIKTKHWYVRFAEPGPDKPEEEMDMREKEWLSKNGVQDSQMKWVCFVDTQGITRGGIKPYLTKVEPPERRSISLNEFLQNMALGAATIKAELKEEEDKLKAELDAKGGGARGSG